jgi:hypothetical protein
MQIGKVHEYCLAAKPMQLVLFSAALSRQVIVDWTSSWVTLSFCSFFFYQAECESLLAENSLTLGRIRIVLSRSHFV